MNMAQTQQNYWVQLGVNIVVTSMNSSGPNEIWRKTSRTVELSNNLKSNVKVEVSIPKLLATKVLPNAPLKALQILDNKSAHNIKHVCLVMRSQVFFQFQQQYPMGLSYHNYTWDPAFMHTEFNERPRLQDRDKHQNIMIKKQGKGWWIPRYRKHQWQREQSR